VLINKDLISAAQKANLGKVTSMIIVGKYTPTDLDYAKLTKLQSLRMYDGAMTDNVLDAISSLATTNTTLRYIEIPHWGPEIKASAFALTAANKDKSIQELVGFEDVTTVHNKAFHYCNNLTSVFFANVTTLGTTATDTYGAFESSGLISVSFPKLQTVKPCVVDKKRCCKTKANSGLAGKRYLNYSCFSLTKNEKRHDQYPTKAVS
jgi:hypothetical protein